MVQELVIRFVLGGAVDDARGARLGSVGLAAFALVVLLTVHHVPAPLVLLSASRAR